jgi:ubiquinone/menaquinone biosynthesis C-methylase UbiE
MKLNRIERWFVISPFRRLLQYFVVQWFRQHAGGTRFDRVLEIGCGGGAGARMISEQFVPGRLFLVDLDARMVRRAASNCEEASCADAFFCAADAARLPFQNASMDTIFGFGFLHHLPAWKAGMAEIARVLRPGGTYFFEEYYPGAYQNWITRRLLVHPEKDRFNSLDLKEGLAQVGLSLQQTFELRRFGIIGVATKML